MTYGFILSALLALPGYHRDEPSPAKTRQLELVAAAVAAEARTPDEAAFLLALGQHESGYSLAVHSGNCPPKMCDVDRHGVQRARSPWQVHRTAAMTAEQWAQMVGVENTRAQVREAAKRARWALRQCPSDRIRGAFRVLGGVGCQRAIKGENDRVATFESVRRRLP